MSEVKEYRIYAIKAFRMVDGRVVEKTIKIGCTSNIKTRIKKYEKELQEDFKVEILEIVVGTDKEAGDREYYWADIFGTRKGHRYEHSAKSFREHAVVRSKDERKRLGIGFENNSNMKDKEFRKNRGIGFETLNPEKHREIASMGGKSHSSKRQSDNGIKGNIARWSKVYPDRYKH